MTSMWRHGMFVLVRNMSSKTRAKAIAWYQISTPQVFIFQVHTGLQQSPRLDMFHNINIAALDEG